ncbi:CHRD domain-containing protein [Pontibacter korlensis]|uniref:CHRD domain-containing protein n=1 Tax=Pontibacter korlensis TaxID=400092 RepID=UPI000696369B|nr:CHRD domain-containing protein [Pontibacter korlensis]
MKTHRISYGILTTLLLSLMLGLGGCNDDDDDDANPTPMEEIVMLKDATLSGTQEVPPNNSAATGTFKGQYNKDTKRLSYTITFAGITPTAMHFHKGEAGMAGPVVVPINPGSNPYSSSNPFESPLSGTTPALTAEQEADLLAGNWFLNVHSAEFPDGEIRAQITQ